jgi:hypothetical protein
MTSKITTPAPAGLQYVDARDGVRVDGTPEQARLVDAALVTLAGTTAGAPIARGLRDGHLHVDVWSDEAFDRAFGGAGGIYWFARDEIVLPQRMLWRPDIAALSFAHEGTHYLDAHQGHTVGIGLLAVAPARFLAASVDGVRALAHGHDPLGGWVDGFSRRMHATEVHAYMAQAAVGHEAHMDVPPEWSVGLEADGTPSPHDVVERRIEEDPFYRWNRTDRAIAGAGVVGTVAGIGALSTAAAGRLAGKPAVTRTVPYVAATIAATGVALLARDVHRYRKELPDAQRSA